MGQRRNGFHVPEPARTDRSPRVKPERSNLPAPEAVKFLDAGALSPSSDSFAALTPAHLLALQRTAGNEAVAASVAHGVARRPDRAVQRWALGSALKAAAAAGAEEHRQYDDLLDGFQSLAIAAINQGGRNLDSVRLGPNLTAANRAFLEHVRKVLILAQESSAESQRSAKEQWPAVAVKMQAALDRSRQFGISGEQLATIADNVALVGERYVHAPHRGPSQVESPQSYADLWSGIEHLLTIVHQEVVDKRDAVTPLNIHETNAKQRDALKAVPFGSHLIQRHRQLLEKLRMALILARTEGSARQALQQWQAILGDLRHVFKRGKEMLETDISPFAKDLDTIGEQLIHGGVYAEAHNQAVEKTKLRTPEMAFEDERVKEACEGFEELHKFMEKAEVLTGQSAIDRFISGGEVEKYSGGKLTPALAKAIFEIVHTPGEIREKLEEFKKAGLVGKAITVADMADKILAMRQAAYEFGFETVKHFAEKQVARAVEAELKEQWEKIGKWAEDKLAVVRKVGKVAVWISLAVSAVKIIDDIRQGKWAEALREAGETALGLAAGAAAGAGGSAMIGGIGVVIAAEMEGIAGAAAMIRYCRNASVREAAGEFIAVCSGAVNLEAQDLVANTKLLEDPSMASERALIEQKLESDVPYWLRHLGELSDQLDNKRTVRLGGQPQLQQALGKDALAILQNPGTWVGSWQSMAQQIQVIFAGANGMAKYVVDNYPRREKTSESEGDKAKD